MMSQAEAKTSMNCTDCQIKCKRFGKNRSGSQRFRCVACGKTYTDESEKLIGDMKVPVEKAVLALKLLIEGSSVRTTERISGLHRDTICRLLILAGEKCEKLLTEKIQSVLVRDVEVDEIWSYVGKKESNKIDEERENNMLGDAYTFVGMERHSKLVLAWHLGRRDSVSTMLFMRKLRTAIDTRHWFQMTTDGFAPYPAAIQYYFGYHVNYATLVKVYRSSREGDSAILPARSRSVYQHPSSANRTLTLSARRTSNGRTSPCACKCAD